MANFHFNLRYHGRLTLDEEGEELDDPGIAVRARQMAIDMMRTRSASIANYLDCCFEVSDATGVVVHRLPFEHALPRFEA